MNYRLEGITSRGQASLENLACSTGTDLQCVVEGRLEFGVPSRPASRGGAVAMDLQIYNYRGKKIYYFTITIFLVAVDSGVIN